MKECAPNVKQKCANRHGHDNIHVPIRVARLRLLHLEINEILNQRFAFRESLLHARVDNIRLAHLRRIPQVFLERRDVGIKKRVIPEGFIQGVVTLYGIRHGVLDEQQAHRRRAQDA